MALIKIMDYDVQFPYSEPYDIQKLYMEKVIHCLHNKVHGVLESPTGTGKTLCLLAPVSAWVKRQKVVTGCGATKQHEVQDCNREFEPKKMEKWGNNSKTTVWYTARTHSQIAQTIAEMRKCGIEGLNIRVLGARDQLCINSEVLSEKESYIKTVKCKELTKSKNCKYYRKLHQERDHEKYYQLGKVLDIEDLVSVGKMCGICPYYLSKASIETADIVFLPYNYIIDHDSRDSNNLQFQGDVVIFDEGHNVPDTCEKSFEFSFTSLDIALGIKNVKDMMVNLAHIAENIAEEDEEDVAKHAENSIFMVEILQKLEVGLSKFEVTDELLPVSKLYRFFEDAGITCKTASQLLKVIEDFNSDSVRLNLSGSILTTFNLLAKVANTLFGSSVRSFDDDIINRSFKCGVRLDPDKVNKCKQVSLYCFNPSFGIRSILQVGVQSIIITSGTLSPLKNFIHELNIPKPVILQNGHIAKKCQVPFLILGTGVNNVRMDAAFTNRNDPQYIISLGNTLTNLVSSVPDGVLMLFSSYSMMQKLKEVWESEVGIWKRLDSLKRVFLEPRGKEEFINCMENYKRAIDSGNGAILMGVLRGKVSEGLDFRDQYCRAVFIIGVPFPPVKDPRVKGKEKYAESLTVFDAETNTEKKLYTDTFMSVEAMKATNQAIGRVIRHGQDYGAIVLVDYRFSWPRLFLNISPWIRETIAEKKDFPQAKKILREFFRNVHLGKLGIPEVRCQRVDGNGCPIAGHVSYEEYDHKTAINSRTPAPWISASFTEYKPSSQTIVEYISETQEDISSLYGSGESHKSSFETKSKSNFSVFYALAQSQSSLCYGEMKMEGKTDAVTEKLKRKCEDEGSLPQTSKMSCLNGPSAPDSVTEKCSKKKFSRFKVAPFTSSESEPESITENINYLNNYIPHIERLSKNEGNPKHGEHEKNDESSLKMKLLDYFKLVKSILTDDEDRKFKKYTMSYMKSEKNVSDMIIFMDRIFIGSERRKLFSGFGICIKSRDRDEWERACQTRNIDVSQVE